MATIDDFIKDKEETEYSTLINSVSRVIIISANTLADPDTWQIHIASKILELKTTKLESPITFRQQYIKVFRKPAPSVLKKRWFKFITFLGALAEDGTDEEDSETYMCQELLSELAKLEITNDMNIWIQGNHLLDRDGCLCYPSNEIKRLLDDLGFKCDIGRIGKILTLKKQKLPGTNPISILGHNQRVWRFCVDAINEFREKPVVLEGVIVNV